MEQFEFNCFLLQISKKLTFTDFKQLKFVLHGYVPSSKYEEMTEAFLYFEELQRRELVTPANFGVLKQAFDVIGRPDLVELLQQKEQHFADVFRKLMKGDDTLEMKEQKESKEVGKNDPPLNGKELLELPAGTQMGLKVECLEVEKEKVEFNSSEGVKKKEAGLPEAKEEDPKLDHKGTEPKPVELSESTKHPQEQEDDATEVVPYGTLIDFGEYEDLDVVNLEATISKEPVEDGCPVPASSTTVENAEDKETTEPVEEKQMSSHSDYERTGDDYLCRGDFKQATACFQQFLGIAEEKGDKPAEARVYGKLGDVYEGLHDFNHAMKCHTKRLVIAKELGDRLEEGVAYSSIGNAYESRGDFHRAIEYHNFHLAIAKEIGDRAGEGTSYGNLGDAYERLGNFGQAMKYRKLHLTIAKEVGDRVGLGAAYSRLGKAYHNFGDFKQAIEYHNQHLAIAKERGDKVEEGIAYCNLGIAYHRLGDFSKAVEYHEKDLCIAREVGDTAGEGASYGNLGNIYHSIGDYQQAIEYHQMHLSIARRVGSSVDEGAAYCNLGRAYQALGDFEKAVTLFERDLVISKELDDRSGEGTSYGNLGSVYEKIGDFEKAIEYHRQSLNIAKDVGDRSGEGLACGNLGKAYYGLGNFVTAIECHKQQLSLAKKVGDKALEADACYSLGRAFEMTGSLIEALDNFRSSVEIYDSLKALLESRDSWKINFRDVYENAYRSLWRTLLRLQKTEEALFVADQGRAQALVDLMKEQYGFHSTAPCEHKEMIGDFVNDVSSQVVFLALESDKINVWVLGQGNEIQFRQKPEEAEYVHEFPFPTAESSWRRLYDAVIGPVADLLHGDELIIVPDGPLWLAPYAAFLDHDSRYLSETFRIRLIPSLTSLKLILDCPGDYHCESGVLLVGDPCSETERRRFPRLPHAKKEVEMIGKMFQSTPLTGEDATKEAVLERMGSVALIHIAAHSSSGEIVLAASELSNYQDSFLSEEDVKAMKLRARLVVLSCSHFAVHEDIKAEGVFGIARAFLGAGARSVVVSLRGIDDEAAMKFMENFYHHLGGGYSASVALQHAQKCLRESEDFAAEMHWAPFVLIGDDVTIELSFLECS